MEVPGENKLLKHHEVCDSERQLHRPCKRPGHPGLRIADDSNLLNV